uniref:Uncharacterized protein n=1 Tax=Micrurus surinamensis TaxID=129470 RepID=A0A2D4NY19_MICSU
MTLEKYLQAKKNLMTSSCNAKELLILFIFIDLSSFPHFPAHQSDSGWFNGLQTLKFSSTRSSTYSRKKKVQQNSPWTRQFYSLLKFRLQFVVFSFRSPIAAGHWRKLQFSH